MTTIFLSGSRSISRLAPQVQQRLDSAIANNHSIVVGDANGVDKAMQKYLASMHYPKVEVYYVGAEPRNNLGHWEVYNADRQFSLDGWLSYAQKDKKMAELADSGLVVWDGESAGSIHNVFELLKNDKKVVVFYNPKKVFINVNNQDEALKLLKLSPPDVVKQISDKIRLTKYLRDSGIAGQKAFNF